MRRFALLLLPVVLVALIGFVGVSTGGDGDGGSGGGSDTAAPAGGDGGGGAVAIVDFAFDPEDLEVAAGTEVTWTNEDGSPHSIQDDSGQELFEESEDMGDGDTFSFTYDEPGSYPYLCGIHNYMQGTVTVS